MNVFPVKTRILVCLLLLLSSLPYGSVFANDLNTGGQLGVVRTLSATTLGKYGITIGGGFKYAADREYVKGPGGSGSVTAAPLRLRVAQTDPAALVSGDLFAAYGITGICDISADLPIYKDITGWGPSSTSNIGDLEIAAKLRYPFERPGAFFSQAYYLKLIIPTGGSSGGFFPRHAYYIKNDVQNSGKDPFSGKAVFFNPMLVWTFDFGRLQRPKPILLHANFGGILEKLTYGTTVTAALALEFQATHTLTLFTELTGEARVRYFSNRTSNIFSTGAFGADPVRLSPGFRLRLPKGFYCLVAGDIGLTDDQPAYRAGWNRNGYQYSTKAVPKWGGQLIIGWAGRTRVPDRDRDSILDSLDKCPNQSEDLDGFEDSDGCPDYDNDKDAMADSLDKCPNQPEDRDGFEDTDGCPDYDNDKDGSADSIDKCPNWPEDRNGFNDEDGCPDNDNDRDGIPDSLDKCPNLAEDFDGFEDADGCPDYDNDADGVADSVDKCPSAAGPAENDGCPFAAKPKTLIIKRGPLILNSVMFENGKAALTPVSCVTLDQVANSLMEWSGVKLEIQGHTDLMEANLKLSQQRAEAVQDYLIQRGIASDRLKAVGYGKAQPIAGNNSALGRQKNRRVELHRID